MIVRHVAMSSAEANIHACIDWMLEEPGLATTADRREYLSGLTPASFEETIATADALLRGGWPRLDGKIWTGSDVRIAIFSGRPGHPSAKIVHSGIEPADRPETMAALLADAQETTYVQPEGVKAAGALLSLGGYVAQAKLDGNGREARREWASLAYGIEDTPEQRAWYSDLLTEGSGNDIVNPRVIGDMLSSRHGQYHAQRLAAGMVPRGEMPIGVQRLRTAQEPDDFHTLGAYTEFKRWSGDIAHGLPVLLGFLAHHELWVEAYMTQDGRLDADRIAGQLVPEDEGWLLATGGALKKGFITALGDCFARGNEEILGSSSAIIRNLEASGHGRAALLTPEAEPSAAAVEALHDMSDALDDPARRPH